jgi:YD repeat-containing protein
MLRASEIDKALAAARVHAKQRLMRGAISSPERGIVEPQRVRGISAPAKSQIRKTQSVQSVSGTGINPWWRYQESSLPGDGRLMINVGTGNVLVQDDDMTVPHKGIALAFRRTYNSQSLHDVNGDEGAGTYWTNPGLYGNGWTNTFDAHVVKSGKGMYTVYDVDGARYDYVATDPNDVSAGYTGPPGQHATLTFDGGCGFLWTKKSGTTYYFYRDNPSVTCPALNSVGGYAGRLYQIVGRNRNTTLTFNYTWDNGDASATGKINAISVVTESGSTATLSFADVSGHRLLQQLVFPDGSTSVNYSYDSLGNLVNVSRPPNNTAGTRPAQSFGYLPIGSGSVLRWASSPRWCASGCGNDGAYTAFAFTGSDQATSTISAIALGGVVNPSIPDNSNSPVLQPGMPQGATYYDWEYYTTGVSTPTFRDTEGHATNWVVDAAFRPIQTQQCTTSVNQTCSANSYLVTNETWDSDNNLVSEVDPRGGETDYAYDAMGNTIAVGEPLTTVTTSGGSATFRPTKLFDYDANSNLIAYCDEKASHAGQGDWTAAGPPTAGGPDSLCSTNGSSAHSVFTFSANGAPSYEPFGQLTNIRSPLGYNRSIGYAASRQGGTDFGLPTSVQGDAIPQPDGARTPLQSFTYDASGNLICSMADGNDSTTTTVLAYDSLNRVTAVGDPDDATLTNGACNKIPGIAGSAIVSRKSYYPDGSVATTQSPSEAAASVSTQFQYDLDGNETSEVHHYTSSPATTQKWYDGADRLVEVQQPTDPSDFYPVPWTTRYLYDLTQGGTVAVGTSAPYRAYGGLFKTQELLPSSTSTPSWAEAGSTGNGQGSWQDTAGTAFDALDRAVAQYRSSSIGMMPITNTYDGGANAGLLSQTCNANNECETFAYDERGLKSSANFSVSSSSTQTLAHDEDGRLVYAHNAAGTVSDTYDANGRNATRTETIGTTTPATVTYDYYADDLRADLSILGVASMPDVVAYTYRADGLTRRITLPSDMYFNLSYTGGRRLTSRMDSTGQAPYTVSYTSSGSTPTSFGLPVAENLPAWQESAMQYNAEGGQTAANSSTLNNGAFYPTSLLAAIYTTRGEVVKDLYPTNSEGGRPALFANGVRLAQFQSYGTPATAAYTFDAKQSFPIYTNTPNTCNATNRCSLTDSSTVENDTSTQYRYDAVGRQIGQIQNSGGYVNPWQESTKSYDAQDHLLLDNRPNEHLSGSGMTGQTVSFSLGYVWGALNHPLQVGSTSIINSTSPSPPTDFQYDSLFWDDDSLLFTVNSAGAVDDIKIDDFADYVPGASTPLTIWDRSADGVVHGCHNSSGAWTASAGSFEQSSLGCSGFAGPTYGYGPLRATIGHGAVLTMPKSDGLSDGYNTIQGVRVFDTQAGVWNTPDAYRGDVHDPMSQKPYMWNRNNPYAYSDASGYNYVTESLFRDDDTFSVAQSVRPPVHELRVYAVNETRWGLSGGIGGTRVRIGAQGYQDREAEALDDQLNSQNSAEYRARLAEAEEKYPGKAGKFENHHIEPKYLGGAASGPTVRIPAAYHQAITNEFRALAPYGQPRLPPGELGRIMNMVYGKYPLP